LRSSHDKLPFFTSLTRDATAELKDIHARIPVILPKDRMMDWLSPEKDYMEFLSGTVQNLHFEAC
jgi:putative SOS response-associated peptidase YedK